MSENKFEKLRIEWDRFYIYNDCISTATKEHDNFIKKFPKEQILDENNVAICNGIANLTLDQYTNLLPNEYFTNWVERETKHCGALGATYSKYGIKRNAVGVNHKNTLTAVDFTNTKDAEEYFKATILPQISMLVCFNDDYKVGNLLQTALTVDIRFARKVAYLYNPDKLLPIFKRDVIEAMAKFFEVEDEVDATSYKATEPLLEAIAKKFGIAKFSFEVTQKLMQFLYPKFANSFALDLNMILHGAPGTGKTFQVTETVKNLIELSSGDVNKQMKLVQFHPSYRYEEFIDGIKPKGIVNGSVNLALVNGEFKKMCKEAFSNLKETYEQNKSLSKDEQIEPKKYYFIADEINRVVLSRVFGEVLLCIEKDKRLRFDKNGKLEGMKVKTQNSSLWSVTDAIVTEGEGENQELFFGIPENLYFIGTMNDIDRSVESFDMALRRRFIWKEIRCDYTVLDNEAYRECCEVLNDYIINLPELGTSFELGHGYFMDIDNENKPVSDTKKTTLWGTRIQPLLKEYLRASYSQKEIEEYLKKAKDIFMCKAKQIGSTTKKKTEETNGNDSDS